jgi:1,4-alpha-glucan branching enzyme
MITVRFLYLTGLKRGMFRRARLVGSWNGWTEISMVDVVADDGCPAFAAEVEFDDADAGRNLQWGVRFDGPVRPNVWAVSTEVGDEDSHERYREFVLPGAGARLEERYYLTDSRRLGAQKFYSNDGAAADLKFSVWAPNAQEVHVVFGQRDRGYIGDDGTGVDPMKPVVALQRRAGGAWESGSVGQFDKFVGDPYMFRIVNAQGHVVYRTDIHSRWQTGRGDRNPACDSWNGDPETLDGTVSCSVVVDQDVVRAEFTPTGPAPAVISDEEFWYTEFTPGLPVPTRIEDLVIYEMHVGALGFPRTGPGTLADAMELLDYLVDLGINAVELLPIAEFSGNFSWGYGDTHHFAIESSLGGRDEYKHFVRECHRRGIAVIQDVVYNHFDNTAERAEWQYDSELPEQNCYYWYEGTSTRYPRPDGGYLNNGSSGYAPNYREERVRGLFVSSAAELIEDFHVDGLRVDLTQAIHRDNTLNANGQGVRAANLFGQKFLREWGRTLRLIRPSVMLIAEDHTGWPPVIEPPRVGGLGFDATWFAEFYHHLIGDADMSAGAARLLREAGFGDDRPLQMGEFADRLWRTQLNTIAYHESHDEAGNSPGSARTIKVAVNDAVLWADTRAFAEARCRVAGGLAMLSAGTPMFFMGEEIGAQKRYRFDNVNASKEDLLGERAGVGAALFRFYQDLIRLRRANPAVRSRNIDIVHVHNANRVIVFIRRDGRNEVLVAASLNNQPFSDGYVIQTGTDRLSSGEWQETFNSDAGIYGGRDIGNFGSSVVASDGRIELRIPANGFLVLQKR